MRSCDGSTRSRPDEHGIDPGGLERRGVAVAAVDEAHARCRFEQLDGLGAWQLALRTPR